MFGTIVEIVLGGDTPHRPLAVWQVASRALGLYLLTVLVVRIGKSRLLGRASALDVILGFLLGSLVSRGITGSASLTETATACVVLVGIHWWITLAACSHHVLGWLFKGGTYLVIKDGAVLPDAMRRGHISLEDLKEELRLNGNVEDIDKVKRAYKERSGQISVVKDDG
jgi:uncharacterized membrane protein YcaP (DUF421 family)